MFIFQSSTTMMYIQMYFHHVNHLNHLYMSWPKEKGAYDFHGVIKQMT